ncbi:MAG: hypothetical protein HN849_06650 [Victivallales bacterium]|jgi:hypothetical protein|nr:hypothetical protein [Victivallales bacterium]MBT7299170.1 hypothetical protein [Victivallales bacterium]
MKSAFELAMERLGGSPIREYTAPQKEQLAEVDRMYDSRVAQARMQADSDRQKAEQDPAKLKQVQDQLTSELASLEGRRERDKDELRKQFDAA